MTTFENYVIGKKNVFFPHSWFSNWKNLKNTDSIKINRPGYKIRNICTEQICSPHFYASFGTFCVQNGQLFVAQWVFEVCLKIDYRIFSKISGAYFKLSEEFEIDVIFLWKQRFDRFQTFFKDSLCLQKLTVLDAKGAKRSVKMWATNFLKISFKNILLYMNGRLSKIGSVHTYGVR